MSIDKCRTATLLSTNNQQGLALVKLLECHNRECPHCRGKTVEKQYKIMSDPVPMILYYKIIPEKEARSIALSTRRSGGFYWMCPQGNGMSVIISSDNSRISDLFPLKESSARTLLDKWISECPLDKCVSHTRASVPDRKKKEKKSRGGKWTNKISGTSTEEIKDIISRLDYEDMGNGMFKRRETAPEYIKVDDEYSNVHI